MHSIQVNLGDRSYGIRVAPGSLDRAGDLAAEVLGGAERRAVIITNEGVGTLYAGRVTRAFRRSGFRVVRFLMGDGERFKSLRTAEDFYSFLISEGIERRDVIIALGGGVVGDLAGFVAGTFLRGLRLVQIPTTLLAQIDSSVGGKTGVNHPLAKNMIGVFHQPSLVIIDPLTLETLPHREIRAGLFEAIKYGVIRDKELFSRMVGGMERIKELQPEELTKLIAACCEIKADVVARDEREGGLRRILNFGHTVGHALESVTKYRRFHHGEAVGHGMRAAARIAERMALLEESEREAIDEAVARVGRLPKTSDLALSDIISAMRRDKKAERGRIAFVLPTEIGRVILRTDVPLGTIRLALRDALS